MLEEAKIAEYETKLKDSLFLCGHAPGAQDAEVLEECVKAKFVPDQEKNPNFWAWYALVVLYEEPLVQSWKKPQQEKGPKGGKKKEEKKKEETNDDDFDPFAEETEEDKAELAKMKEKNKKEGKKKEKKKEVPKSLVLLEVKGYEAEQNLDDLMKRIFETVTRPGLLWKTQYRLEEVAFGIKKVVVGMTVEDETVSVDDVIEEIQEKFENEVQSIEIIAFNKI